MGALDPAEPIHVERFQSRRFGVVRDTNSVQGHQVAEEPISADTVGAGMVKLKRRHRPLRPLANPNPQADFGGQIDLFTARQRDRFAAIVGIDGVQFRDELRPFWFRDHVVAQEGGQVLEGLLERAGRVGPVVADGDLGFERSVCISEGVRIAVRQGG